MLMNTEKRAMKTERHENKKMQRNDMDGVESAPNEGDRRAKDTDRESTIQANIGMMMVLFRGRIT
jgi:hypothetical protein